MINLDEHMEEHLAAKAKEQAENEKMDQLHYEALVENERRNRVRRDNRILAKIANSFGPARHEEHPLKIVHNEEAGKLFIGGVDVTYHMDIKEEYTSDGRWRSHANGRLRITVGDYGSRKSYPQNKTGGHNYEAIQQELYYYAKRKIEEDKRRRLVSSNEEIATDLRRELGLEQYYGSMRVNSSSSLEYPVFVTIEVKNAMTPEQARKVHAALKSVGLVK